MGTPSVRFAAADAGDVVDVCMGQQDVTNRQLLAIGERQEGRDLVARIDEHGVPGRFAADDEAVLEERADRLSLNYHGPP